jgi:hypothetical protein
MKKKVSYLLGVLLLIVVLGFVFYVTSSKKTREGLTDSCTKFSKNKCGYNKGCEWDSKKNVCSGDEGKFGK